MFLIWPSSSSSSSSSSSPPSSSSSASSSFSVIKLESVNILETVLAYQELHSRWINWPKPEVIFEASIQELGPISESNQVSCTIDKSHHEFLDLSKAEVGSMREI